MRICIVILLREIAADAYMIAAFDWASLAPGSTLVDVGGGVGSASLSLATHLGTRVRFVVQDRERVCTMGRAACDPTLLENGVVQFDGAFPPLPCVPNANHLHFST